MIFGGFFSLCIMQLETYGEKMVDGTGYPLKILNQGNLKGGVKFTVKVVQC